MEPSQAPNALNFSRYPTGLKYFVEQGVIGNEEEVQLFLREAVLTAIPCQESRRAFLRSVLFGGKSRPSKIARKLKKQNIVIICERFLALCRQKGCVVSLELCQPFIASALRQLLRPKQTEETKVIDFVRANEKIVTQAAKQTNSSPPAAAASSIVGSAALPLLPVSAIISEDDVFFGGDFDEDDGTSSALQTRAPSNNDISYEEDPDDSFPCAADQSDGAILKETATIYLDPPGKLLCSSPPNDWKPPTLPDADTPTAAELSALVAAYCTPPSTQPTARQISAFLKGDKPPEEAGISTLLAEACSGVELGTADAAFASSATLHGVSAQEWQNRSQTMAALSSRMQPHQPNAVRDSVTLRTMLFATVPWLLGIVPQIVFIENSDDLIGALSRSCGPLATVVERTQQNGDYYSTLIGQTFCVPCGEFISNHKQSRRLFNEHVNCVQHKRRVECMLRELIPASDAISKTTQEAAAGVIEGPLPEFHYPTPASQSAVSSTTQKTQPKLSKQQSVLPAFMYHVPSDMGQGLNAAAVPCGIHIKDPQVSNILGLIADGHSDKLFETIESSGDSEDEDGDRDPSQTRTANAGRINSLRSGRRLMWHSLTSSRPPVVGRAEAFDLLKTFRGAEADSEFWAELLLVKDYSRKSFRTWWNCVKDIKLPEAKLSSLFNQYCRLRPAYVIEFMKGGYVIRPRQCTRTDDCAFCRSVLEGTINHTTIQRIAASVPRNILFAPDRDKVEQLEDPLSLLRLYLKKADIRLGPDGHTDQEQAMGIHTMLKSVSDYASSHKWVSLLVKECWFDAATAQYSSTMLHVASYLRDTTSCHVYQMIRSLIAPGGRFPSLSTLQRFNSIGADTHVRFGFMPEVFDSLVNSTIIRAARNVERIQAKQAIDHHTHVSDSWEATSDDDKCSCREQYSAQHLPKLSEVADMKLVVIGHDDTAVVRGLGQINGRLSGFAMDHCTHADSNWMLALGVPPPTSCLPGDLVSGVSGPALGLSSVDANLKAEQLFASSVQGVVAVNQFGPMPEPRLVALRPNNGAGLVVGHDLQLRASICQQAAIHDTAVTTIVSDNAAAQKGAWLAAGSVLHAAEQGETVIAFKDPATLIASRETLGGAGFTLNMPDFHHVQRSAISCMLNRHTRVLAGSYEASTTTTNSVPVADPALSVHDLRKARVASKADLAVVLDLLQHDAIKSVDEPGVTALKDLGPGKDFAVQLDRIIRDDKFALRVFSEATCDAMRAKCSELHIAQQAAAEAADKSATFTGPPVARSSGHLRAATERNPDLVARSKNLYDQLQVVNATLAWVEAFTTFFFPMHHPEEFDSPMQWFQQICCGAHKLLCLDAAHRVAFGSLGCPRNASGTGTAGYGLSEAALVSVVALRDAAYCHLVYTHMLMTLDGRRQSPLHWSVWLRSFGGRMNTLFNERMHAMWRRLCCIDSQQPSFRFHQLLRIANKAVRMQVSAAVASNAGFELGELQSTRKRAEEWATDAARKWTGDYTCSRSAEWLSFELHKAAAAGVREAIVEVNNVAKNIHDLLENAFLSIEEVEFVSPLVLNRDADTVLDVPFIAALQHKPFKDGGFQVDTWDKISLCHSEYGFNQRKSHKPAELAHTAAFSLSSKSFGPPAEKFGPIFSSQCLRNEEALQARRGLCSSEDKPHCLSFCPMCLLPLASSACVSSSNAVEKQQLHQEASGILQEAAEQHRREDEGQLPQEHASKLVDGFLVQWPIDDPKSSGDSQRSSATSQRKRGRASAVGGTDALLGSSGVAKSTASKKEAVDATRLSQLQSAIYPTDKRCKNMNIRLLCMYINGGIMSFSSRERKNRFYGGPLGQSYMSHLRTEQRASLKEHPQPDSIDDGLFPDFLKIVQRAAVLCPALLLSPEQDTEDTRHAIEQALANWQTSQLFRGSEMVLAHYEKVEKEAALLSGDTATQSAAVAGTGSSRAEQRAVSAFVASMTSRASTPPMQVFHASNWCSVASVLVSICSCSHLLGAMNVALPFPPQQVTPRPQVSRPKATKQTKLTMLSIPKNQTKVHTMASCSWYSWAKSDMLAGFKLREAFPSFSQIDVTHLCVILGRTAVKNMTDTVNSFPQAARIKWLAAVALRYSLAVVQHPFLQASVAFDATNMNRTPTGTLRDNTTRTLWPAIMLNDARFLATALRTVGEYCWSQERSSAAAREAAGGVGTYLPMMDAHDVLQTLMRLCSSMQAGNTNAAHTVASAAEVEMVALDCSPAHKLIASSGQVRACEPSVAHLATVACGGAVPPMNAFDEESCESTSTSVLVVAEKSRGCSLITLLKKHYSTKSGSSEHKGPFVSDGCGAGTGQCLLACHASAAGGTVSHESTLRTLSSPQVRVIHLFRDEAHKQTKVTLPNVVDFDGLSLLDCSQGEPLPAVGNTTGQYALRSVICFEGAHYTTYTHHDGAWRKYNTLAHELTASQFHFSSAGVPAGQPPNRPAAGSLPVTDICGQDTGVRFRQVNNRTSNSHSAQPVRPREISTSLAACAQGKVKVAEPWDRVHFDRVTAPVVQKSACFDRICRTCHIAFYSKPDDSSGAVWAGQHAARLATSLS